MSDEREPLHPGRTALLLMDLQPGVLALLDDGEALAARAAAVAARARALGVRVVHVRAAFSEQDYRAIPPTNKAFAPLPGTGFLADGTAEAAVHPALGPEPGDVVVTKTRFGAFSTSNLVTHVNPRTTDTLVLGGMSTSGVVLSTLRDAADRDYRMMVLSDCCADPDAEVHRVLIEQVFPVQADVLPSEKFLSLFS
jgi:nicotinamidase-related amidase